MNTLYYVLLICLSYTALNNSMYNQPSGAPQNNLFQPNLYQQSGPPQFCTIVNKTTNYITSTPYPLMTPSHRPNHNNRGNHYKNKNHHNRKSPAATTKSPDHSSKDNKTKDEESMSVDDMLRHFDLVPTEKGKNLWNQCFQDANYHSFEIDAPLLLSSDNNIEDEKEEDANDESKKIELSSCNKCEYNNMDLISTSTTHSSLICHKMERGTDLNDNDNDDNCDICDDDDNKEIESDYYHNSGFHFILGIENLGIFEFCQYCFIDQDEQNKDFDQSILKRSKKKTINNDDEKEHGKNDEEKRAETDLDDYLNDMISKQLNIIFKENDTATITPKKEKPKEKEKEKRTEKERNNKQKNPIKKQKEKKASILTKRININLNIDQLIEHCKECGMTESFIDELKCCNKLNTKPHTIIDLNCIQQITFSHYYLNQPIITNTKKSNNLYSFATYTTKKKK